MANFYKSGFLSVYVNKARHYNQPVNMDRVNRIRIYNRKGNAGVDENSDFRIYFEGDDQICWMYDTIEKRDYEYEALIKNMHEVTRPSYDFQAYLDARAEEEEELKNEKVIPEEAKEEVFIYRKDFCFFVTRDELAVKEEDIRYEKGILL